MVHLIPSKSSVLCLRQREIGLLVKSNTRFTNKILKNIICNESRVYKKIWEINSPLPTYIDAGQIFLEHFSKCYTLFGHKWSPSLLYKQDRTVTDGRIVDVILFANPVIPDKYVPSNPRTFKRFSLSLSSKNWLRSCDLLTGELTDSVYLGDKNSLKFNHLDWEKQGRSVVIVSKNNPYQTDPHNKSDTLVVIAIFEVLPLKFLAKFKVNRTIFGSTITNCNVSDGLLIIGTGNKSSGFVKLYSLQHVIQNGVEFLANLNKSCPEFDNGVVGSYPDGIPLNCTIKSAPPCLFEVKCAEHVLHLGGNPFHFVTTPPNLKGTFQVKSLESGTLVKNGTIDLRTGSEFENSVSFHPDESGKLIHVSGHVITFFKICSTELGELFLQELNQFKIINLTPVEPSWRESPRVGKRRSNRVSRKVFKIEEFCDRTILADCFENELDLYGILGYTGMFFDTTGRVQIYDNDNGNLVKLVNLGMNLNDISFYQITMDLDLLIIQQKSNGYPKFSCFVYRLEDSQENVKKNNNNVPIKQLHVKVKRKKKRFGGEFDDEEEAAGENWSP